MTAAGDPVPPVDPALRRNAEYIKGLEEQTRRMFVLFRLSTFLHGLDALPAISSAVLSVLVAPEGFRAARAALFLVDADRHFLRGYDASGEGERELQRRVFELLDRFPGSLGEMAQLAQDPKARAESSLACEIQRVVLPLEGDDAGLLGTVARGEASYGARPRVGTLPAAAAQVLGAGEWCVQPLRGADRIVALLAWPAEARPFGPILNEDLLLGFCHHAGLAVDRGMIREGLERRLCEMATVQEIARGILSATNLADLLQLFARAVARSLHARWSVAWLSDGEEENLKVEASWGAHAEDHPRWQELLPTARECALKQRLLRHRPPAAQTERHGEEVLFAPLAAFDRTLGVVAIGHREPSAGGEAAEFPREDESFLALLAAQASVAIKNAQLFGAVREAERRLRETQGLLMQTEKLAALGEMSAKVAHEIRNPLSAVGGFARRIQRALGPGDPNAKWAELIVKETERLEGILTEQLQYARISRPRMEMLELSGVVQETLVLVRDDAERKKIRLLEEYAANLPPILLDRDKVKQVLLNILRNALEAVREGQRIQVRTGRAGEDVRVEIANDGDPLPGEILESLFVPFATTRPGGSGLGLAVARQIVQDHGGEIQVKTGDQWSVVFTVSFPVRDNQDRRQRREERRGRRDRRRAA